MTRVNSGGLIARHDVSLDFPQTAEIGYNARSTALESRAARGQRGRKQESLVAQVLHDRVGDRESVSTGVAAKSEAAALEFDQYHSNLGRERRSARFGLRLGRFAGKRGVISAPGLPFRGVFLNQVLFQVIRRLWAVWTKW